MTNHDIISSQGFQIKMLRSEQLRAGLLASVWGIILLTWLLRRWLGGVVASSNALFFPGVALFVIGLILEGLFFWNVRKLSRMKLPYGLWYNSILVISVVIDIAIPIVGLFILQKLSPRGAYSALSAPLILTLPLVIMLCILRLRPVICLFTGFAAALAHAGLTIMAITSSDIQKSHWPLLFSYSVILALTGIASAAISRQARKYVTEAVAEAVAFEKTRNELAAIEHDLSIARDIQMSLMPAASPKIQGFDIAGMARPAQHAGGDYYDWQQMSDGRLVVVLADVTGHGIGPALVMAVCRAYARAAAPSAVDSETLIARINRLIADDLSGTGRFITMVIVILSPDGTVELVSAGHGPTLLYQAKTADIITFGGTGLPLGISSSELYHPHTKLKMENGDVLLLLTDGLIEWPRKADGEQFGSERLCQTFSNCVNLPAKSILSTIDAAVCLFGSGIPQPDDTTAVVIRKI